MSLQYRLKTRDSVTSLTTKCLSSTSVRINLSRSNEQLATIHLLETTRHYLQVTDQVNYNYNENYMNSINQLYMQSGVISSLRHYVFGVYMYLVCCRLIDFCCSFRISLSSVSHIEGLHIYHSICTVAYLW